MHEVAQRCEATPDAIIGLKIWTVHFEIVHEVPQVVEVAYSLRS